MSHVAEQVCIGEFFASWHVSHLSHINRTFFVHCRCEFVNDVDNIKGGYVLIGVEAFSGIG